MKSTTGVKVNVNIIIIRQRRKLTLSLFYIKRAGVGKSYLINIIFQALTRTFNLYSGTSEKAKVLKMVPIGVSVVKINRTTINTALSTPKTRGNDIPRLSDKMRCKLRIVYFELEAMVIDEIFVVSIIRLYQINCSHCEIFSVSLDIFVYRAD